MNSYLKSYINSRDFLQFKKSAEEYCIFLETLNITQANTFPITLRQHLLSMYADAFKLPEVDLVIDEDYEDAKLRESIREKACSFGGIISDIIPSKQFYTTTYSPEDDHNEKLDHGFLIDDIQDIYIDIKEPLVLITRSEAAIQQGIWDIKFSLRHHWGDHCISALHYLHFLCKQY